MKHNWTYKKLTDAATINYGTRVVQKRDGGTIYPVYGGGDATFRMDTYNRENCLVVARFAMSPKCTRRVSGKFFLNDSGLTLEAKEGVRQDYLDWHIIALNDEIYRTAKGAAQKNLDVKTFTSLSIGVPSLDDQQAIVSELDGINHLIDLQEEQLREYDRLAQSLFYTTFGDPTTNPKGWEVKKLGEVAETTSGGTPSKAHNEYYEGGTIPWLRSGEVSQGLIYKTELFITQAGLDNSSAKIIPVNSVAIAMYGATVGEVGIIKAPMSTNQAVCSIFPNESVMPIYLLYFLRAMKPHYINIAAGGAQPNISQAIIRNTKLPLPPLSLQQSFAAQIEAIEQQKALVRRSLDETRTLLAARMQYYFE